MDVDDAMAEAGGWGRFQVILYVIIALGGISDAFISIQFVYAHYEPEHHCKLPNDIANITMENFTNAEAFLDFALPKEIDHVGKVLRSSCRMYNRNYSAYESAEWPKYFNESDEQIPCNNDWIFRTKANEKSAVTEFSMICEDDWKAPFVVSIYMAGMAFGSFLGTLADRFGRRPVFLAGCLAQVLFMTFSAFSWNFSSYIVASFFCGASALVNYVASFVVGTEMTDVKWRNFMAVGSWYSYAFGYCLVPFFAYFFRDWRTLMLVLAAVSAVLYLPNLWLFPESVHWLTQTGRTDEALTLLKRIAKTNGKDKHFDNVLLEKGNEITVKEVSQSGLVETFRVLFRSDTAGGCLAVLFSWFFGALVYNGLALYSTSFSEDRFLNVLLAAVCEFPALLAGFYMIKFIGRPRSTFLLVLICSVTTIVLPLVPEDLYTLKTVLSMLGKGAVTAAFYQFYLIASEISPTLQRSSFMSTCSFSARIGSFISPFLMFTGKIYPFIPNGVMGTIGISCAFVVIFCVPETKGVSMPDTAEEAKQNKRIYGLHFFRKFTSSGKKANKGDLLGNEVPEAEIVL